ncbi:MAG: MarR family transcriptional regulator [Pseudolabrys sp.]|nr:MarR family transcriptional regulator [Pseudolabrys sp.]
MSASADRIATVRRFNRFYTKHLGVLQEDWLDSPFSLTEARVLYELTQRDGMTATAIGTTLGLDAGYLSRLLQSFQKRGLISRRPSPDDARQSLVSITATGRKAFAPLDRDSQNSVGGTLSKLSAADQHRLTAAMGTIENLIGGLTEDRKYTLRGPRHGDFGWIVSRHAELYAQEYGWVEPFEGLCAGIVADYVNKYDPKKERCWIAELNGENVGCVMLVKDDKPGIARIRLLLVDPAARGLGLGARLVDECVKFSRKAGYRGITLWTHSILSAARHVYEKAGFILTGSEKRKSWSQDVVAEFWDLKL